MDSANRIDWTWPIGVFALVAVTSVANAQSHADVFPDRNWQRSDTPEQRGWSGDKLRAARAYADTINTAAVIIVDDGIVVDEWGETDRKFNVHSVRKSLLSAMIGIFEEQGTLNLENTLEDLSIDDRLGLTADERRATLADLLGSRSGVYHPANLVGEQLSARWPERGSHDPGTYWFYSN